MTATPPIMRYIMSEQREVSNAEAMRLLAASALQKHQEKLAEILHLYGGDPDAPLGIKTWSNVCAFHFKKAGHTNTNFGACECMGG